jgi:O-acetyl-ADP-ribose deacetylase (regulator of RNase III)
MHSRIEIIAGDITKLVLDAIVNAANSSLLGGGGVDGAIHRGAGPELYEECKRLKGCPTGEAKITKGYNLPAKHVIHTVGPIWNGGERNEDEKLARCYRNSLLLAAQNGLKTIAFPAISTGAYGFPMDRAARIAIREAIAFLAVNPDFEKVIFCCFGPAAFRVYEEVLIEVTDIPHT